MRFRNHADLPHFSLGPRSPTFLKPGFPSARFLAKMVGPASSGSPIVSDFMVDPLDSLSRVAASTVLAG